MFGFQCLWWFNYPGWIHTAAKKTYVVGSLDYSCTCTIIIRRDMHVYTDCIGGDII